MCTPEPPASHGAELLAPLLTGPEGSRTAVCPACLAVASLPSTGGWLHVRCESCGTDFVASDGSPPPAPPPPPPPPPPEPPEPPKRRFAHWAWAMTPLTEGKWCPCPSCRILHVQIRDADPDEEAITCPACYAVFRVGAARSDRRPTPAPVPAWAPSKMHGCLWALGSCLLVFLVAPFALSLLVAFFAELFRRLMG